MSSIFARAAFTPEGWVRDVRVDIGADGTIASVTAGVADPGGSARILLPAPANVHGHAFQRAMAGMTERRGPERDSFWTWRAVMYRFLDALTPEDVEAIAAFAYVETLEAGFASVGEFHYLHHGPGGARYDDPAELSARIFAAAATTGIGLTHLPALYSFGGAGAAPLAGGQLRFGEDLDGFLRLAEAARTAARDLPADTRHGVAPHSLRATTPDQLRALPTGGPVHIHVAEQTREIDEVVAWLGARPVEWLLDNLDVGPDWCLIHATHMTPGETTGLARSGAVVGLCPITEANLGDGVFDGPAFLAAGGAFAIGSDSNVRIALNEELRQLEYSQRLRFGSRNALLTEPGSTGDALFAHALRAGAQATARPSGALRAGCLADIVTLDAGHVAFAGLAPERTLDGWIFAAGSDVVRDVWSAGRHCVRDGRHVARDAIEARYRRTLRNLAERL